MSEVLSFSLWAVMHLNMVAVKAPANNLAAVGVGTAAFAVGQRPLVLWRQN